MSMTNEQIQALKAAAEKASTGEWIKESSDGWDAMCSDDDQANSGFIIAHFVGPDSQVNREFMQSANPSAILSLLAERDADKALIAESVVLFETLRQRIAELEAIRAAAEKLVRCKGRYHSEQNYRALAALFGVSAPDLPPLDSEARTLTVKLPEPPGPMSVGARTVYCGIMADVVGAFQEACAAAGITLVVGE